MSIPWLHVNAIDLRACHPGVKQCDLFDLTPAAEYQVGPDFEQGRCCIFEGSMMGSQERLPSAPQLQDQWGGPAVLKA